LPGLQAHSSLGPLQQRSPGRPQITQRKQGDQLLGVFGQPFVANFDESELALDDPERMFDLGSNAGLELFCLIQQVAPGRMLVQCPALARAHRHMPLHARGFGPLVGSLVAGISKDHSFFTMQQRMALGDIVDVGRCANDGVNQSGLGIHADVNTKGLPASI
jgi:hypothetical protein